MAIDLGIRSLPTVVLFKCDRVNLDSRARCTDSLSTEAVPTAGFANANEPIHRMFDRVDAEIEHFGFTHTLRKIEGDWKIVSDVLYEPETLSNSK